MNKNEPSPTELLPPSTLNAEDIAFKYSKRDTARSKNTRRIVVTGLGIISPNGINIQEFWENTKNGISGIKKITSYDTHDLPIKIAGEVSQFDPRNYFDKKQIRYLDRFSQFSLVTTRQAIEDAKLSKNYIQDNENIGIFQGTSLAGIPMCEDQSRVFFQEGLRRIHPLLSTRLFPGAGASHIAIEWKLHNDIFTFSTGCTSSTDAIGMAFREIKRGNIDLAIVGGSENPISPLAVNSFDRIKLTSTKYNDFPEKASRPFDKKRDGLIVGEGSAMFVLEELQHALKRNAKIYCEITGFGTAHDAYHIAEPSPTPKYFAKAMENALNEAEIDKKQIEVIFVHGNSVPAGDVHETRSIKYLFREHSYNLFLPALESMVGHAFGAIGALKLCAAVLSIKNQFLFPTINYEEQDDECDLNYVPNIGIERKFNRAIINSSSFGGKYSVIAIQKYE